jgi:hypothetical protein|tara:strand:+ start:236 stop:352 length:117 start_codon:yes stop_codon:yes gene_type:complete
MGKKIEVNTDGDSTADAIAVVAVLAVILVAVVNWLSTF